MSLAIRSRLRSIRDRIGQRLLPTGSSLGLNRNDREGALHRAWGHVITSQIRGAYYEFGVYRGDTFRASQRIYQGYYQWQQEQLQSDESWRRKVAEDYSKYFHHFYAFDTFGGMPENDEGNITFSAGTFLCTIEEFTNLNQAAGIETGEKIRYFSGMFSDVKDRNATELENLQPAAIVNLDCDLYSSAKDALSIAVPKLVQGAVLLSDDWNAFEADKSKGERKAIKEMLIEHPKLTLEPWFPYHYTGQSFLVHLD